MTSVAGVERLRALHGQSTRAWVGDGLHRVEQSRWLALSGARHVDYNLALCHGPGGVEVLPETIETVLGSRRQSIIALAGETIAQPQALSAAGWVRVGSAPLMTRTTVGARRDPAVRRLDAAELPAARGLVASTFGLPPDVAEVALTTDPAAVPERSVWGLFDDGVLMACLITMRIEDAVVGWSMSTATAGRRRGFGTRLYESALAGERETGAEFGLHHASGQGEPFYLATGWATVERLEFWSRPRWVLAG